MKSHTLAIALLDPHQLRRPRWVEHCFALCFTQATVKLTRVPVQLKELLTHGLRWFAVRVYTSLRKGTTCFLFAWTTSRGALGRIHTHLQDHNSYTSANLNSSKQTYCSLNSFQRMIGGDSGELHISTQGILPPCQRFWLPAWVKRPAVTSAISASLNRGISSNLQNPRLATCLCFNPINPPLLHGTSLPDSVAVEPKAAKQPSSSVASLSLLPVKDILASILYIGGSEL